MHKSFKRKVRTKWVFSYLCILFVPLLISAGMFSRMILIIKEDISTANLRLIEQVRDTVDRETAAVYDMMQELSMNTQLNRLADESAEASPQNAYRIYELTRQWLPMFSVGNQLASSVYVFFPEGDFILTAKAKYSTEVAFSVAYSDCVVTFEEWRELMDCNYHFETVVLPQKSRVEGQQSGTVSMVLSIPYIGGKAPQANIIVRIDSVGLQNILDGGDWLPGSLFSLEGKNGEIIYSNFPYKSNEVPITDGEFGNFDTVIVDGKDYVVVEAYSDQMGWRYRSFVPEGIFGAKMRGLYFGIIITLLLCIGGGGALIVFLLRRQYKPLEKLVIEAGSNDENAHRDEYELISQALLRIKMENQMLGQQVEGHRGIAISNYISLLIKGEIDQEKSNQVAKLLGLNPWRTCFCVLLFHQPVAAEWFENWEKHQELLSESTVVGECFYAIVENLGAAMLNFDVGIERDDIVRQVTERLFERMPDTVVTVGTTCCGATELSLSYKQALETREYCVMMPGYKIITYEDIPRERVKNYQYDFEFENVLIKSIKENDRAKAALAFDRVLANRFEQKTLSLYSIRCTTLNIISIFVRTLSEECGLIEEKEVEQIIPIAQLTQYRTLEQLKEALLDVFDRISVVIQASQAKRHSDPLVEKCLQYIQDNYTESALNVSQIAQAMDKSPNYISRKFKEWVNMGILDYINELRIRRAKVLLATTQLTIGEISEQVGYYNHVALIRAFKHREGVSPSVWRTTISKSTPAP